MCEFCHGGMEMIRFEVLGSFELWHDEDNRTPKSGKLRQALALLALSANRVVPVDVVIAELWGPAPPRTAVNTAQTYVYQLRRLLRQLTSDGEGVTIETSPPGYRLVARQDQSDVDAFTRFSRQGRAMLAEGRAEAASERLGQALALWRGEPLSNVAAGPARDGHAEELRERRMDVLRLRIQADTDLGRHRELVPELKMLVREHPLDEWLHGRLILALHALGRRAEALDAYQRLRTLLRDELGLDPSPEVGRIHQQILGGTAFRHPLRAGMSVA